MNESTIVIANGTALIGKGLGKIIDGFDRVVRFNEFKLEGFEEDLGTRVTHHVCNFRHYERYAATSSATMVVCSGHHQYPDWVRKGKMAATIIIDRTFMNAVSMFIGAARMVPSGGTAFTFWALLNWGGPVHVANFNHAGGAWYWQPKKKMPGGHPWEKESRWFDRQYATGNLVRLEDQHANHAAA